MSKDQRRQLLGSKVLQEVSDAVNELPLLKDHFDVNSLKKLGRRGHSGVLFRAQRRGTQVEVALKRLGVSARALNELLILSTLNRCDKYPCLCGFEGAFRDEDNKQIYIAMLEYGEDLQAELQRRYKDNNFFTEGQVLELAEKMTEAVGACHDKGCAHCDIRLAKFVREGNNLRLLGFRRATPCTTGILDHAGGAGGIAPEIYEYLENGSPYDYRVDIYSLGLAIRKLASYTDLASGRSEPLHDLLCKMTAKEPSQRPSLGDVLVCIKELRRPKGPANLGQTAQSPTVDDGDRIDDRPRHPD